MDERKIKFNSWTFTYLKLFRYHLRMMHSQHHLNYQSETELTWLAKFKTFTNSNIDVSRITMNRVYCNKQGTWHSTISLFPNVFNLRIPIFTVRIFHRLVIPLLILPIWFDACRILISYSVLAFVCMQRANSLFCWRSELKFYDEMLLLEILNRSWLVYDYVDITIFIPFSVAELISVTMSAF